MNKTDQLLSLQAPLAKYISTINTVAVQIDARKSGSTLTDPEEKLLTRNHLINLFGLAFNGGPLLYDQQFGIDSTTVKELKLIGMPTLAAAFNKYIIDGDGKNLELEYEKHDLELGHSLIRAISSAT